MRTSRLTKPDSLKFLVRIVQYGNAPTDQGVNVYELNLFRHDDGRSPNFYCLYKHPISGKQCCFSCRTSDQKEAKEYAERKLPGILRKALNQHHDQRPSDSRRRRHTVSTAPAPVTVLEFAARYVEEHRTNCGKPLKEKSRRAILDTFNQLAKRVGDKYLNMITAHECRSFILTRQPSERTAQKHHLTLRSAFDQAVQDRLIEENFFRRLDPPRPVYTDEEIEARCFTDEEFAVFFQKMPTATFAQRRLRNMLLLKHETGLRLGELRHIKHTWYDLTREVIRVKSDRTFSPKTQASSRTIPLSDNAIDAIHAQLTDNALHAQAVVRESDYLFPNQAGRPLSESGIENPFRKLRQKVFGDRRVTLHGLRHGLVTRLSLDGLSDRMIMEITGHSTLEMVQRYSHMKEKLMDPVREALNRGSRFEVGAETEEPDEGEC